MYFIIHLRRRQSSTIQIPYYKMFSRLKILSRFHSSDSSATSSKRGFKLIHILSRFLFIFIFRRIRLAALASFIEGVSSSNEGISRELVFWEVIVEGVINRLVSTVLKKIPRRQVSNGFTGRLAVFFILRANRKVEHFLTRINLRFVWFTGLPLTIILETFMVDCKICIVFKLVVPFPSF